jgi:hypothetical protein
MQADYGGTVADSFGVDPLSWLLCLIARVDCHLTYRTSQEEVIVTF